MELINTEGKWKAPRSAGDAATTQDVADLKVHHYPYRSRRIYRRRPLSPLSAVMR